VPDQNVVAFIESAEWFVPAPVIAEIQEGAEASQAKSEKSRSIPGWMNFLASLKDWFFHGTAIVPGRGAG
jgi:hypothetical protein